MVQPTASARHASRYPLILVVLFLSHTAWSLENRLTGHPSPYLALHADDPVAWQPWGEAAFAAAGRAQRLVFVSVGYFACHWCHVMQRESFQDARIGAVLNRHYVAIKVDRELRPGLDRTLMAFVERSQGIAGWPLNVIMTPDGKPLLGFVYQPREMLEQVLVGVSDEWVENRSELDALATQQTAALTPSGSRPDPLSVPTGVLALRDALLAQSLAVADPLVGGFGDQSKFPSVPQLRVLLRLQSETPDPELDQVLRTSLRAMATQGLRDQIDGGFFRYTTDPAWQTPHFEKMLYDNALLAELYRDAAVRLGDAAYGRIARDTLNFLDRRFGPPGESLVASFSAVDAQDVEGGYYLWTRDALAEILTQQELALVGPVWGMEGPAPFEAGYLPRLQGGVGELADQLDLDTDTLLSRLDGAREKLLHARERRSLPVDDKRLAGWNGMALVAFARGAVSFDEPRYRARAAAIRADLVDRLWDGHTLARARREDDTAVGQVDLEDYAWVILGLLSWAELTDSDEDLALAHALAVDAWERYYTPTGWIAAGDSLVAVRAMEPALPDGAIPAASAILIEATQALANRTGDSKLYNRARDAALRLPTGLADSAFFYASHIGAVVNASEAAPPGRTAGTEDG
jgi:uncharacterized protein YyaL (SSP411 family)